MKLLRALGVAVLLWILIFIEISVTMFGLKLSNTATYVIHYILMAPMALFLAWLYYKSKDKVNGFLLGIFMVLVGIILDMIITAPLFIIPAGGSYVSYFSELYLILGLIEGVVLVGIYDLARRK